MTVEAYNAGKDVYVEKPYNANRFGVDPKAFSHFRWFWDYAGGMMTDP
jgi:hypothetical protein